MATTLFTALDASFGKLHHRRPPREFRKFLTAIDIANARLHARLRTFEWIETR